MPERGIGALLTFKLSNVLTLLFGDTEAHQCHAVLVSTFDQVTKRSLHQTPSWVVWAGEYGVNRSQVFSGAVPTSPMKYAPVSSGSALEGREAYRKNMLQTNWSKIVVLCSNHLSVDRRTIRLRLSLPRSQNFGKVYRPSAFDCRTDSFNIRHFSRGDKFGGL